MFDNLKKLVENDELTTQVGGKSFDVQQMYKMRAAAVRGQVSPLLCEIMHAKNRIKQINTDLTDPLNTARDNYVLNVESKQLAQDIIHTRKRIFTLLGSLQHIAKIYNIENVDLIQEIQDHADTYLKGNKYDFKSLLK